MTVPSFTQFNWLLQSANHIASLSRDRPITSRISDVNVNKNKQGQKITAYGYLDLQSVNSDLWIPILLNMDLEQFLTVHNANDDFIPQFDLGMDEIMAAVDMSQEDTVPVPAVAVAPVSSGSINIPNSLLSMGETLPANTISLSDNDIHDFVVHQKAKSTTYKDTSGTKRLQTFLRDVNPQETRMFYELSAEELDKLMCQFFILAKKLDKKLPEDELEYQPDTLTSLRNSWQRVIADKGLKFNIKRDAEFERSRTVLAGRRKQLTNMGLGNKPNAARALEQDEVDRLYETGFFGTATPIAIQRTMWWKISLLFGYRGREESIKIQFGDIKLVYNEIKKEEYLEWDTERGTKTRPGSKAGHQRSFNPTAHQFNTSRCPVQLYKEYVKRRPVEACHPDSRFYLTPIPIERIKGEKWFYATPLGKNKLARCCKGQEV